jgi:hypothetical protein
MALPIQPSGYIKTINDDGTETITDLKFVEVSFTSNPPVYQSTGGLMCPHCGGDHFRYLVGTEEMCVNCNEKMVRFVTLDLENKSQNDDTIESRFDILDL